MICIACIAEEGEEEAIIATPDGAFCKEHATDFGYCWNCGRAGDLCFGDMLPDEWSGACRRCISDWDDTVATERYHSYLWDVGR